MDILSVWSSHLKDPKEKEDFEKEVLRSKNVLDRLKDLVNQKDAEQTSHENSLKAYDNPNWSHRQAHLNGFRSCQTRFSKLLTLDQKERNDPRPISESVSRPTGD